MQARYSTVIIQRANSCNPQRQKSLLQVVQSRRLQVARVMCTPDAKEYDMGLSHAADLGIITPPSPQNCHCPAVAQDVILHGDTIWTYS